MASTYPSLLVASAPGEDLPAKAPGVEKPAKGKGKGPALPQGASPRRAPQGRAGAGAAPPSAGEVIRQISSLAAARDQRARDIEEGKVQVLDPVEHRRARAVVETILSAVGRSSGQAGEAGVHRAAAILASKGASFAHQVGHKLDPSEVDELAEVVGADPGAMADAVCRLRSSPMSAQASSPAAEDATQVFGSPVSGDSSEEGPSKPCSEQAQKIMDLCASLTDEPRGHDEVCACSKQMQASVMELDRRLRAQEAELQRLRSLLRSCNVAWENVSLAEARERLAAAARQLQIEGGGITAENEIEKWELYIKRHPDYVKEQKDKAAQWAEEQRSQNDQAFEELRGYVPPGIRRMTLPQLERFLPKPIAARVYRNKVLWWVRDDPRFIARMHIATLRHEASLVGLSCFELRAVFAACPEQFANDPTGEKAEWRSMLVAKLMELVQESSSRAPSVQKAECYDGHPYFCKIDSSGRWQRASTKLRLVLPRPTVEGASLPDLDCAGSPSLAAAPITDSLPGSGEARSGDARGQAVAETDKATRCVVDQTAAVTPRNRVFMHELDRMLSSPRRERPREPQPFAPTPAQELHPSVTTAPPSSALELQPSAPTPSQELQPSVPTAPPAPVLERRPEGQELQPSASAPAQELRRSAPAAPPAPAPERRPEGPDLRAAPAPERRPEGPVVRPAPSQGLRPAQTLSCTMQAAPSRTQGPSAEAQLGNPSGATAPHAAVVTKETSEPPASLAAVLASQATPQAREQPPTPEATPQAGNAGTREAEEMLQLYFSLADSVDERALALQATGTGAPAAVGPFGTAALDFKSIGFVAQVGSEGGWPLKSGGMYQIYMGEQSKAGLMSPACPVTLSRGARSAAGVPEAARTYAFAHPLVHRAEEEVSHLTSDPRHCFLALGGLVYFDAERAVCGLHAFTPGGRRICFDQPETLLHGREMFDMLRRANRVHEEGSRLLQRRGVAGICWLAPGEHFPTVMGADGEDWEHGALMFALDAGQARTYCIYPVLG